MNKTNVIVIDFIPQENWGFKEKLTASSLEKWNVLSFKTNTLHGSKLSSLNVLKKTQYHLIIACDTYHPTTTLQNVKVLNDCHGSHMLDLKTKCHCVVCPLKDLKTSSGQLVVL